MLRKPLFWVAFLLLSVAGALFAYRGFPSAFPLVSLDLTMDRPAAVTAARDLARREGWGPAEHRTATSFHLDREVQAFVELEAGGNEAFARMLREGLYSPYVWQVRLFAERQVNEVLVRFTPAGEPYGFREELAESAVGASLAPEEARRIGEGAAARILRVDLGPFHPVETSSEVRPTGRVDHTFVYERGEATVEAGRYRLRLVVSGDRLTEVTHFVEVPEAFERRYEHMRSVNNTVAAVGAFVALVLFTLGGIVGLVLLLRDRWVLWKAPVIVAAVVAVALFVVRLSQWPLVWMDYDTALSASTFALTEVARAAAQALAYGIVTALMLMAAESLTRRAFPRHIQLFQVWRKDVASSREVWGQTAASYLVIGLMLAYFVLLYTFARQHLGWWTPSDALFDPDAIASHFPWLHSLVISMVASVTEETVFRAIPLASAVLLGRRFGGTRYWLGAAVLLQALVFGSVHANYPAQPAYARIVEIALPFTLMGLVYIRFGLLPCLLTHFVFDVVLFSLPLFASAAPGLGVGRTLVVALALIPVWLVLVPTLARRRMGEVPEEARNGAWIAPSAPEPIPADTPTRTSSALGRRTRFILLAAGSAGLVGVVLGISSRKSDAPRIEASREAALGAARAALAQKGVTLPSPWKELSTVQASPTSRDRFVWGAGGDDLYRRMLGSYLPAPRWSVRYVRFEGDVAERAEEYRVFVDGAARVQRLAHLLPEERAGRSLSRAEAEALALQEIAEVYGLAGEALAPVSSEPSERPARRDWSFTYRDRSAPSMDGGEARITVEVAGDEVTSYGRLVHLPEEWERQDRQRGGAVEIAKLVTGALVVLLLLAGGVVAVIRWSRGRFATRTFLLVSLALSALGFVDLWNRWPWMIEQLSSAQPFEVQVGLIILFGSLGAVVMALIVGLNVGLIHPFITGALRPLRSLLLPGAALGLLLAAAYVWLSSAQAASAPVWPSFSPAGARVPLLAAALDPLGGWVRRTTLLFLGILLVDGWSRRLSRRLVPSVLLLFTLGFVLAGQAGIHSVEAWILAGGVSGGIVVLSYLFVLRHQMGLLPVATAVSAGAVSISEGVLRAYPGALVGSLLAVGLLGASCWIWLRRIAEDVTERSVRTAESGPRSVDLPQGT